MIHEEIVNKIVTIEIRAAKTLATEIINEIKKLLQKAEIGQQSLTQYLNKIQEKNKISLKDLVKKGQLESIKITDKSDLKAFKKVVEKFE